jgi:hypothetical protein
LLKLHLGDSIFRREGREDRNDIYKEELGMEVQSKVDGRLQSRLGRWAEVNWQQDLCGDGMIDMGFRHDRLLAGPSEQLNTYSPLP